MENMNLFNDTDDAALCEKLRNALEEEFCTQYKNGVYGFLQKLLAYSSNHLEGSTLTSDQTNMLFDTKTLAPDESVYRIKDVEEAQGHFLAFNHLVKTMHSELSEELIKDFHYCLKAGVFEDRANGYKIGDYKEKPNVAGDTETSLPKDVPNDMNALLSWYHEQEKSIVALAEFHARFEKIHPFQDGNGRVGRIILFRESLLNDMCPVIVKETQRLKYIKCIKAAQAGDNTELCNLFRENQIEFRERLRYFF